MARMTPNSRVRSITPVVKADVRPSAPTAATPITIFNDEMCERGYSAGNPQKPFAAVVKEVDTDLTPLFLKMAFKIKQGELSPTSLDESVCDTDPESDPAFTTTDWNPEDFRCSISTRYRL